MPHTTQGCPDGCQRFWVVIPDDHNLITPAEWANLSPYMQGSPVYSAYTMQAARIDVYLEDAK
jgi:hypothetical protein